jgi:vitamin B12 transporter
MARTRSLALVFLLSFSNAALAQVRELPEILISAGQFPLESERVGASATVLSGEKLRAAGVQNVADALRSVPGVTVAQSGGRGTLTEVRIRGAEANQLTVLIDGIEVNQVGEGGFDFADLPVDDVERIEVIRGPQSGIYGANAHAGVISIVTRSGKGLTRPRLDAKLEAGSLQTYSGSINARGAAEPVYGSVTATNYSTRGYNIARFGSESDGSRALTLAAKGGVDIGEHLNVEGVVRYTDRSVETDPQDFNFGSPTLGFVVDGRFDRTTYQATAGRLGATLKLFDGHWIQNANVKYFDERLRGFAEFFTFGGDGTRTNLDYKSTFLIDTNFVGGERHTVSLLVDDRHQVFVQLGDPRRYVKDRLGLAGEYVLDLPSHTTLSAALRKDWNSAFADVLSWRVAMSQRFPASRTRLHASAGKGVTEPTVFEVLGSTFNLPNPNILPEQSIGWDAGIEQQLLDGRLIADLTYFSTEFRDKIELDFTGPIYVNGNGIAKRRGIEVAATWQPLEWLTATATYTYTDAIDSLGRPEIRRSPHAASLETTARFADKRARATLGVSYNSTRKDIFFGDGSLINLPAVTVVRALFAYDLTPATSFFVRAENLFNARYEEIFSYRAPVFRAYAGLRVRLGEQ